MKKNALKLCSFAIALLLTINMFPISTNAEESTDFNLTSETRLETNSIYLEWSNMGNVEYQVFQSVNGSDFETVSAANLDDAKFDVQVLNVYPEKGNNLKTWMETNGYGKGIIHVDEVGIVAFNANPSNYLKKDANGKWNYDVVFFGSWDSNNGYDITPAVVSLIESFVIDGKGLIVGHDTMGASGGSQFHPNFCKLAPYVGIGFTSPNWSQSGYSSTKYTKVKITKQSLFTSYPWNIGEVGTILTIPEAHNLGQYALNDRNSLLKFVDGSNNIVTYQSNYGPNSNSFLTVHNNCAQIQTGHSSGAASVDEQKIIANLLFYCDQLTSETSLNDYAGQDIDTPLAPTINIDGAKKLITLQAEDRGTQYFYYVKTKDLNGNRIQSNTTIATNKAGIKGYYYIVDNNSSTKIMNANSTFSSGAIDMTTLPVGASYLHVAAVDNAGNVGEQTNINLNNLVSIVEDTTIYTTDLNNGTTNARLHVSAAGTNIGYQWQMSLDENSWSDIQGATTNDYDIEIDNIVGTLYFRCKVYNPSLVIYSKVDNLTASSSTTTNVYVTQSSEFNVIIPKTIILDGQTGIGDYKVIVDGNIAGYSTINIKPDGYVTLSSPNKKPIRAIITQDKMLFTYNDLLSNVNANGSIQGDLTAGTWNGSFNFVISMQEELKLKNSIGSVDMNDNGITSGIDENQNQLTQYNEILYLN